MLYIVTFTINIPQMLAYIYHTWIRHGLKRSKTRDSPACSLSPLLSHDELSWRIPIATPRPAIEATAILPIGSLEEWSCKGRMAQAADDSTSPSGYLT